MESLSRLSDPQVPPTLCSGLNHQCALEALGDSSPQSQGRPRGRVSAKLDSQVSVVQRPWPAGPSHEAVRGPRVQQGAPRCSVAGPQLPRRLQPPLPTPSLGDFYLFGSCKGERSPEHPRDSWHLPFACATCLDKWAMHCVAVYSRNITTACSHAFFKETVIALWKAVAHRKRP